MTTEDEKLAHALVHDANIKLQGASSASVGLDAELDNVRAVLRLAEKLLHGSATDDDRAEVPNVVHPQVKSLYLDAG
jgi:hypothetical protein